MTIRHSAKATFCFLLAAFFVLVVNSASNAQEPELIQITNSPGEDAIGPSWSPQGNTISFITNRGSGNGRMRDVWAVAPDGSNPTRLTVFRDDGYDTGVNDGRGPVWIGSTGDLAILDVNFYWEWLRFGLSQNPPLPVQRNVLDGASPYFAELLLIPGGLLGDSFAVSIDGQSAGWSVETSPNCPVVEANAVVAPFNVLDGQPATQVGTIIASARLNCTAASRAIVGMSYSPDASQLVLSRVPDPNYLGYDLEIYNASGGLVRKLTNNGGGPNPVTNWNPSWSPDGSRIAFASNMSGQFQIYIINPDGTNLTPVTTGGGDWPTWSPDSSTIAFQSTRGGNSEIYSVPAPVSSPPGNLSATVGNQSVALYWNMPPSIPQGFNIYADLIVGTTVTNLGLVNTSGPVQQLHFAVSQLPGTNAGGQLGANGPPQNGQLYRFRVTSVNGNSESTPSIVLAQPAPFAAPPHPRYPVLFLPGIDADASAWQSTADFLTNTLSWTCGGTLSYGQDDNPLKGDPPNITSLPQTCLPFDSSADFFTVNFGNKLANSYPDGEGISHQGNEVGGFLDYLGNRKPFSIVAWSMGGLAARSYIQNAPTFASGQIKDLITLGTPHLGVDRTTMVPVGDAILALIAAGAVDAMFDQLLFLLPDKFDALQSRGVIDMDGGCVANGDSTDMSTLTGFLRSLDYNPQRALPSEIRYVVVSGTGMPGYFFPFSFPDRCVITFPFKYVETDLVVPNVSSTLAGILPDSPEWTPKYTNDFHTGLPADVSVILCSLDPKCTEYQASSSGNTAASPSGAASSSLVDIQVTAPNGNAISNGFTSMPGAKYSNVTDPTGHQIASVVIPFPQGGEYTITPTPKPGAKPTDTFTILQIQGGVTTTIAQDMPIQNIPPAGFQTTVQSGSSFMQVSPVSLDFGNVRVSRARKIVVTLKNTSATRQSLGPFSLTVTGGNASDFSIHPWCGAEIGPGKECTIAVHFTPQAVEAGTATLSIVTSASTVPLEVPITGSGIAIKK